jgi:hypothetical protein
MTKYKPPSDGKNVPPRLDTSGNGPPALSVDIKEFTRFLDGTDWTEDQKAEYLRTLWGVMVEFAMLGFGFHPVQQAEKTCGKFPENGSPRPGQGANAVDLKDQFKRRNTGRAAVTEDSAV